MAEENKEEEVKNEFENDAKFKKTDLVVIVGLAIAIGALYLFVVRPALTPGDHKPSSLIEEISNENTTSGWNH